jgi:hypothetical protein
MDEELVSTIIRNALSHDKELQRQTIIKYFAADIKFHHFLVKCKTREAYLKCFRCYTLIADSQPVIKDIAVNDDVAVVYIDQHIRTLLVPTSYWRRCVIPTLAVLRFQRLPNGHVVIKVSFTLLQLNTFI